MTENRFTPPEAQSFKAHPENRPTGTEAVAPVTEESEKPFSAADNLPANFELKLKKLTRDFAFSEDPQAQDFLRLASQVNNLSNANLSEEKLAALKTALSQALDKAENAFATNTNMFAQVLSAFDNSPQEFKRAYLQKQKNSANSEGFSSYLQTTYQRTKLRRLRDVYLGLLVKLQQYENTQTPVMAVAEKSAVVGKSDGDGKEAPVSITGEQVAIEGQQHLDTINTSIASGSSEAVGTSGPAEGDNQTMSSAAEGGSNIASFENNSFKSENSSADSGNIAAGSGGGGVTPPESPSFGDAEGDNGKTPRGDHLPVLQEKKSPVDKSDGKEVDNKQLESAPPLYKSFVEQIDKLKEIMAGIKVPNAIGVDGVNQYFTSLEEASGKLKALDHTLSTYNSTLSMEDLMQLRELFERVNQQYLRLSNQADYDFSQKRILAPQMWVDQSVYNLVEKLTKFYKETDDEIERSAALQNAKDAAGEVAKYLENKDVQDLHYEARKYIDNLLTHIDSERIIPSKNAAVEAMRKAKTFPDALEWLFYNANAKGDPAHIAKTIEVFQKRAGSHYDNLLKNPELRESERQAIEKAKKQAVDFMKVMWDNALNGNYANDNVSLGSGRLRLAKGAKNNERALIENFIKAADKGAAERANNQLNMNEMFHTLVIEGEGDQKKMITEHFDWVTQGKRETVDSDKNRDIGPLQELIFLIYQKHLSNRGSDYSFEKLFLNLQDGASLENGALMDALVDKVLGKNAQELKQRLDEESDSNFKKTYERIYQQLQYHSEDMFAVFKAGVQYKIARDNLTELAAFQNAALNGASLPNVGGNELKKGSFGTMASIPVQLLRFRSDDASKAPNVLPLAAGAFNLDKVFNTTAETMVGKVKNDSETDIKKRENIKGELTQFITKYKYLNEEVIHPQMKALLPDITSNLAYWWQGGIPPEVYALNSGKSLSAWKNAEEAMMKLQKIAVMSETRYNDNYENENDYRVHQRDLNTIVSIIQGYTGTAVEYRGRDEDAKQFWQDRNKKLAKNDGSLDYVDINVLSLYLSALTYEVIGNPSTPRTVGIGGNSKQYEGEIEQMRMGIINGAGNDNALKKDLYVPIVKWFFEKHGKMSPRKRKSLGFLGLGLFVGSDESNDFMIDTYNNQYFDSALKWRIYDYKTKWLRDNGYEEQSKAFTNVNVGPIWKSLSGVVGNTQRDQELYIMSGMPTIVGKVTEKDTL